MVRRSHYLVLWSRLGNYDPGDIDALTSADDRRLFEGWQHAASIIPLTEYRYQLPHQRNLREHPTNWYNRWLNETVQKEFVPQVLERIRQEGALKVSDFESDGHTGGTWWNWRPAKVALEFLYAYGELMIADRVKFQTRLRPDRTRPATLGGHNRTNRRRARPLLGRARGKGVGCFSPSSCRRLYLDESIPLKTHRRIFDQRWTSDPNPGNTG